MASQEESRFSKDHVDSSNSISDNDIDSLDILNEDIEEEHVTFVTSKSSEKVPKVGMVFSKEDEAYKFYNEYAKMIGFSVRRDKYRRLADGMIRKRSFVCSKHGQRRSNDPSYVRKINRLETRTGCLAMIELTVEDGIWIVSQFVSDHNHELVGRNQQDMLRSQRQMDEARASIIDTMDNAGIKPNNIFSYIVEQAGGAENVGFLKSDCDNFLRDKKRHTLQAGDAQSVINHFQKMQANDPSFFYTMQLDFDNRMTNFFWRDGRSKIDYTHFGDVVIFDTTYRTNKYNMVCAPFIGVNHHRQNILFGCAFLLDETTESFVWLFESFLQAMGKKQPRTIFTDQCQAMANAIEKVFSETQHRLCLWHIGQNAAKHLAYYLRMREFKTLFNKCLYNCETEEEFQEVWNQLLTTFDLSKSSWLKTLFDLRKKWCPAFSKNYFSAGIMSTQRSESMNNVFRGVTTKTMSLTQFVFRYEKILERRRRSELMKDFQCNQGVPSCAGKIGGIIKQAATEYTYAMFQEFQNELWESLSVAIEEIGEDESFHKYKLVKDGDRKEYIVKFRSYDCMVNCTCQKFESVGILCLHALKVLNFRNIFVLPPQYILKRWTKGAKDGLGMDNDCKSVAGTTTKAISLRMSQIMRKAVHFASKGALTVETTKMAEKILEQSLKDFESMLKVNKVEEAITSKGYDVDSEDDHEEKTDDQHPEATQLHVLDPLRLRMKGLTNARMKSQLEKKNRKRKIQVEHNPNDVVKAMNKKLKGVNQGQRSKIKGSNFNELPRTPSIIKHLGPSSSVTSSNVNMNFGVQDNTSSSISFVNQYMPLPHFNQASLPNLSPSYPVLLDSYASSPIISNVQISRRQDNFQKGL